MRRVARWCVEHRRIVVAGWLVALVAFTLAEQSAGSKYRDSFKLSGTQSFQAQNLLQAAAPKAAGDSEQVVIAVNHGSLRDPQVRARVAPMLARLSARSDVASVISPYAPAGAAQISREGTVAFARVNMTKQVMNVTASEAKQFVNTARGASGGGVHVEVGGQVAELVNRPSVSSSGIGASAALIVLMFVFGSLLAALTPLLTAGVALGTGTAVIGLLSHVITMASFSSELSLLIGLGVGVDYALFIVTRMRQGVQAGKPVDEAIVDALDTSGRAVLFAGITVCIALLGMFALGVSFLYGVAIAASIAVAFTVLASLTLLPAVLSFIGPRVLSRRQRRAMEGGQLTTPQAAGGFWARWSAAISARPATFATVATVIMAVIAIPFLSMRLGSSDAGSDPSGTTTRNAYDLLAHGFGPGYNGPLQLVAKVNGPGQQASFDHVVAQVARTPGVVAVTRTLILPANNRSGAVAIANAYPRGSPQDASTSTLLNTLRDHIVPAATASSGVKVLIGGQTAIFADFSSVLSSKLPLFIGVVVALSFLLLVAVFRSLLIPAMAAIMNLLSAAAAFGVVTAVFQNGVGAGLLGITTGPIQAFVPVMMFAILFGLSMDYEVFLVSRIYEEWHRTGDNRLAVTRGLAATGRTITAAAVIMGLVFGAFILGGAVVIKLFGLGLASAVLLDALIVRASLVPSLMLLCDKWNWKLPHALDRVLPRLNVEGNVQHKQPRTPGEGTWLPEPEPEPSAA
jgi:putative drug exporter of the RND superfamily